MGTEVTQTGGQGAVEASEKQTLTAGAKIAEGLAAKQRSVGKDAGGATETAAALPAPTPLEGEKPKEQAGDEVATLRDRLAKLEKAQGDVAARRNAEDFTNEFIRTKMDDLPPSLVRKLLPVSSNETELRRGEQEIRNHVKAILQSAVKHGTIRWVNVGGSTDGGITPMQMAAKRISRQPEPGG